MDSLETEKAINELRVVGALFLISLFNEDSVALKKNPQLLGATVDLAKIIINRT